MTTDRTGDLTDFTVKAVDDDQRIITGIATTPRPDRSGDVIDPLGATFTNPVPLLLGHDTNLPVGEVTFGTASADGIPFTATLPRILDPGPLKDRVDGAWQAIKARLLKSVSPGYRAMKDAIHVRPGGGLHFLKTEFLELSLVTIPANADATITAYKAVSPESKPMPTIHEQITHWNTERGPLVTRMTEMVSPDKTLSEVEQKQYDDLADRVQAIDAQVGRLQKLEKANIAQAAPITATPGPVKSFGTVQVRSNQMPGAIFTRALMAEVCCRGNKREAADYAATRWPDMPEVALHIKAAVAPGTTTGTTWAAPLTGATAEFIDLLRPKTAIGQITGMLKVPWNVKVPGQTGAGTYNWVGEGKPKPVTSLAFTSNVLPIAKAAGIIVITKELAMSSSPSAEERCRDDMIKGITAFIDSQFIDPAVAAVAGVHPASITNAVTPITSVGPLHDIVSIASAFAALNVPLSGLTYIMSPANALVMSFVRDAQGNATFPGMSVVGGNVNGLKILTSAAAGTNVIGLVPELIMYNDEGGVTVDVSQEASLQMSDTPMDPADATTVFVSLWQGNYIGLRAEWFISWLKASANACKYVNGATYTLPVAGPAGAMAAGATPPRKGNGS